MLLNQSAVKPVVPRRDRGVRGKDRLPRHFPQRIVEPHSVVMHSLANNFQRAERTVSFVEVIDARRDTERPQCLHAANTEYQFLPNAGPLITAVEPASQL